MPEWNWPRTNGEWRRQMSRNSLVVHVCQFVCVHCFARVQCIHNTRICCVCVEKVTKKGTRYNATKPAQSKILSVSYIVYRADFLCMYYSGLNADCMFCQQTYIVYMRFNVMSVSIALAFVSCRCGKKFKILFNSSIRICVNHCCHLHIDALN